MKVGLCALAGLQGGEALGLKEYVARCVEKVTFSMLGKGLWPLRAARHSSQWLGRI